MLDQFTTLDAQLEVRSEKDKPQVLVGYALKWGALSQPMTAKGGARFQERFLPGVFKADLAGGRDVRALVGHDTSKVLGRQSAGTLILKEDDIGLHVEIHPPNTSYANDLMESVNRRDVSGISIGFNKPVATFATVDGMRIRSIATAGLGEVSVVAFPAYTSSNIEVRELNTTDLEALAILDAPAVDPLALHRLQLLRVTLN